MADKKMKGKVDDHCDEEELQETASSSNSIAVEENPAREATDTDQQSLRNRRPRSSTGVEPEPEGKRPRYGSSSSDSTLPDLNSPLNQHKQALEMTTSPAFTQPIEFEFPKLTPPIEFEFPKLPLLESWLQCQEFFPTRTSAPRSGVSIPGAGNRARPPRPPKPPRPPASKQSLELGLHQSAQTSATCSGSQSSIPIVGNQLGAVDSRSAQQQRVQQATHPGANQPLISPQTAQQMKFYAASLFQTSRGAVLQPNVSITCMLRLEDEVNNLKGIADRLQSELADSKSRISKLEAEVKNLKGNNDGLQPELAVSMPEAEVEKSSEGQIATDDRSCSSARQIRPIPSVDAEVPSDMRARSGPGSTSGKDDESKGPATIAAGDGLSAANTDRNEATTESDELQDGKKNANTSQDDNTQ